MSGMTIVRVVSWALGAVLVVAANGTVSAADVSAGRALAEGCAACHGADGISQMELTPSLAGQPDEFVQWQLVYFRSGVRKSDVMRPIAEALSNQDIRDLGAYYASLPPPKPATASDALAQKGEQVALQHRCRSCHADDYNGFRAAARLSGQREDVMVKALHDFKSGKRVGSGVASMADVTYELSDADMEALSRYMATRR
jgi:cytochrome c553